MTKLPSLTAKQVISVVQKLGFVFDRQSGSHAVYHRASDRKRVVVPIHAGRGLKKKTLSGIIKDMGLTIDEFLKLL